MPDFRVQRGFTSFGASSNSTTATITAIDTGKAFARITSVCRMMAGDSGLTASDRDLRDIGCGIEITNRTTLTFTRSASGLAIDCGVFWEVIEYVGAAGGPNEFIRRQSGSTSISASNDIEDVTISGIRQESKCVPFLCGVRWEGTDNTPSRFATLEIRRDTELRLQRNDTDGDTVFYWSVVEFTGSNWQIVNNIEYTFSEAGVAEEAPHAGIPDINHAFVEAAVRHGPGALGLADTGYMAWLQKTAFVNVQLQAEHSVPRETVIMCHVMYNPALKIELITSESAQLDTANFIQDYSISTVKSLATSCVFAYNDSDRGSAKTYPMMPWNYYLEATNNLRFIRARSGSNGDFKAMIIQLEHNVTISCFGIASAGALGTPRIAYVVSPSGIATQEATGTPTITTGAVTVSPGAISSEEAVGTPSVSKTVQPTGISSQEAFGSPTLTTGSVTVSPTGVTSEEAVSSPVVVTGGVIVIADGIVSGEAFGTAVLTVGSVTISANGISSEENFGDTNVIRGTIEVQASGITSEETFGTTVVQVGTVILTPGGIETEESFGSPVVTTGSVTVQPGSILTGEAFGDPVVSAGGALLLPTGIVSAEAFGNTVISVGPVTIAASGIASQESPGTPSLTLTLTVTGIATGEQFGTPSLMGGQTILPTSIPSAEQFGAFIVIGSGAVVYPTSIASEESFGAAWLNRHGDVANKVMTARQRTYNMNAKERTYEVFA